MNGYNEFQIVVANSSREALARLAKKAFDAIIMDLDLQEGAQSVDLVNVALANTPAVLVFYDDLSESDLRISCRRGVLAFVGKHEPAHRLLDGLQAAIAGRQFMADDLQAKTTDPANIMPLLTRPYWRLLDALCRDPLKATRTLAGEFGLSEGRVKNIMTDLFRHFGVKTRHELPLEAARRGFKPGDPEAQRVITAPPRSGLSKVIPKKTRIKPPLPACMPGLAVCKQAKPQKRNALAVA